MNKYLEISPEVQAALAAGKPVVAPSSPRATRTGRSRRLALVTS